MDKIKGIILLLCLFHINESFSQTDPTDFVDNHYKEDQFYIGITYNLLIQPPKHLDQTGFSTGLHFGFIKDMPFNKNRNKGIGLGLGLSANTFNQNLLIQKDDTGTLNYSIITDPDTFSRNKFSTYYIEMPLEYRWRTSTATSYEFWRIYTGLKFSYHLYNNSKHKGDLGSFKHTNISNFNKLQYGLTLSAGYNTWNIHLYYALNPIFSEETKLNGKTINMYNIKLGLMFYIL